MFGWSVFSGNTSEIGDSKEFWVDENVVKNQTLKLCVCNIPTVYNKAKNYKGHYSWEGGGYTHENVGGGTWAINSAINPNQRYLCCLWGICSNTAIHSAGLRDTSLYVDAFSLILSGLKVLKFMFLRCHPKSLVWTHGSCGLFKGAIPRLGISYLLNLLV